MRVSFSMRNSIDFFRRTTNYLFILGVGPNAAVIGKSIVGTSASLDVSSSIELQMASLNAASSIKSFFRLFLEKTCFIEMKPYYTDMKGI